MSKAARLSDTIYNNRWIREQLRLPAAPTCAGCGATLDSNRYCRLCRVSDADMVRLPAASPWTPAPSAKLPAEGLKLPAIGLPALEDFFKLPAPRQVLPLADAIVVARACRRSGQG